MNITIEPVPPPCWTRCTGQVLRPTPWAAVSGTGLLGLAPHDWDLCTAAARSR